MNYTVRRVDLIVAPSINMSDASCSEMVWTTVNMMTMMWQLWSTQDQPTQPCATRWEITTQPLLQLLTSTDISCPAAAVPLRSIQLTLNLVCVLVSEAKKRCLLQAPSFCQWTFQDSISKYFSSVTNWLWWLQAASILARISFIHYSMQVYGQSIYGQSWWTYKFVKCYAIYKTISVKWLEGLLTTLSGFYSSAETSDVKNSEWVSSFLTAHQHN